MANVNTSSSPLTSMESYQNNTARCRRDGQKSGLSSHHEVYMLTNKSFQYYLFVWSTWTSSNRQGAQAPHLRISLGGLILILVRLSLHCSGSIAIPRLRQLHTHPVLHSNIERQNRSTVTMTSGSIGPSSTDTGTLGNIQRRERVTLLASTFFNVVKLK